MDLSQDTSRKTSRIAEPSQNDAARYLNTEDLDTVAFSYSEMRERVAEALHSQEPGPGPEANLEQETSSKPEPAEVQEATFHGSPSNSGRASLGAIQIVAFGAAVANVAIWGMMGNPLVAGIWAVSAACWGAALYFGSRDSNGG